MKTKLLLLTTALIASAATASTVDLDMNNLAANGWKVTAAPVYQSTLNATVTATTDYGADGFRFFSGSMPTSWQFQWASLSSGAYAGMSLASISSVRIRSFGAFGDNVNNWQPPTFTWVVDKGDSNQRCITWQPWSNGNSREPLVWHEYDAATTGRWLVEETGVYYNSLAALKAALPNAYFEFSAELPTDWGYASQQAFNIGNCPLYDGDRAWFSGAAGYVDWFEVGVNGNVTRYDLHVVPEPTALGLLGLGFGILALRRRQ